MRLKDDLIRTLDLLSSASNNKAVGGNDLLDGVEMVKSARQRHDWGNTLSLGRDRSTSNVPQDSSHAPSSVLDHGWAGR